MIDQKKRGGGQCNGIRRVGRGEKRGMVGELKQEMEEQKKRRK